MAEKWTADELRVLGECAAAGMSAHEVARGLQRSAAAVSCKGAQQGVSFHGDQTSGSRAILERNVPVIREDIGGVIGIRWARADRDGDPLDSEYVEWLFVCGQIKQSVDGVWRRTWAC